MPLLNALSNLVSLTAVVDGHGFGLDLMNTLQFPRALGTVNSISLPNPSSSNDLVALVHSASAMCLLDLLPCLKLRNVTTGP